MGPLGTKEGGEKGGFPESGAGGPQSKETPRAGGEP